MTGRGHSGQTIIMSLASPSSTSVVIERVVTTHVLRTVVVVLRCRRCCRCVAVVVAPSFAWVLLRMLRLSRASWPMCLPCRATLLSKRMHGRLCCGCLLFSDVFLLFETNVFLKSIPFFYLKSKGYYQHDRMVREIIS